MKHRFTAMVFVKVVVVAGMTGCASTTGIDPSNLVKATTKTYVELKAPFKWSERFRLAKITHYFTVAPGVYRAKYDRGHAGTYYEGISKCLTVRLVPDKKNRKETTSNLRCGFYVPNNPGQKVKVYFYVDPVANRAIIKNSGQEGTLVAVLAKAEENNVKHLMYQPDSSALRAAIRVVK